MSNGGAMSDLVERVRSEVQAEFHKSRGASDMDARIARRAIKAVAEWLDTVMEDRVAASDLMKQLEDKR